MHFLTQQLKLSHILLIILAQYKCSNEGSFWRRTGKLLYIRNLSTLIAITFMCMAKIDNVFVVSWRNFMCNLLWAFYCQRMRFGLLGRWVLRETWLIITCIRSATLMLSKYGHAETWLVNRCINWLKSEWGWKVAWLPLPNRHLIVIRYTYRINLKRNPKSSWNKFLYVDRFFIIFTS